MFDKRAFTYKRAEKPVVIWTHAEFRAAVKSQDVPLAQATFRCPSCGTLQCAQDLIDAGAGKTLDDVLGYLAFSCVGRWRADIGCDYTLGGLIGIPELIVIDEAGNKHPQFMPVKRCEECGGSGAIEQEINEEDHDQSPWKICCPACGGRGAEKQGEEIP